MSKIVEFLYCKKMSVCLILVIVDLNHVITGNHDDVVKWKHFPCYWPFVRGIQRSPVNSPHKGQWCRASMFSLNCVWINGWVNNREADDLRRYRAHYDVTVMPNIYYRVVFCLIITMLCSTVLWCEVNFFKIFTINPRGRTLEFFSLIGVLAIVVPVYNIVSY